MARNRETIICGYHLYLAIELNSIVSDKECAGAGAALVVALVEIKVAGARVDVVAPKALLSSHQMASWLESRVFNFVCHA